MRWRGVEWGGGRKPAEETERAIEIEDVATIGGWVGVKQMHSTSNNDSKCLVPRGGPSQSYALYEISTGDTKIRSSFSGLIR